MEKIKIFCRDLILSILKYELIVTIPTIILDLIIGNTGLRKFARLLLENYNVPFWFDLLVSLLFFNGLVAILLFLFIRFIESQGSDIKGTRIIGALSSFILTLLTLIIKFFGTLNSASVFLALFLAIIYGYYFLPRKNYFVNKSSKYQKFLKKYVYK
jgi:hypothetical protein